MGMGNNPLIGVDPNGEYFLVDDIIVAVAGGLINLVSNAIQGNLSGHGFWEGVGRGFAAFGAGAIGGIGAIYPEFGGWIWGGATVGATNAWLSGATSTHDIVMGAGIGVLSSVVGGAIGQALAPTISGVTNGITSPVLRGAVGGAVGGTVTGGLLGGVGAAMTGGDFWQGAGQGALTGLVTGTVAGGVSAGVAARARGFNPFTGEKITPQVEIPGIKPPKIELGRRENRQIRSDIHGADFEQALAEWNNVRQQYGYAPVTADKVYNGDIFKPVKLPDGSLVKGKFYYGGNTNPNGWTIKVNTYAPKNSSKLPPVYIRYRNIPR